MDPAPPPTSSRPRPLWLVSGGLMLLVLIAIAARNWHPRFVPNMEVGLRAPEFKGELLEVELDGSGCTIEEIDSELPEIATVRELTDWQIASERATTIELDYVYRTCTLSPDPPPRATIADFTGTGVYSGPHRHRELVTVRCGNDDIERAVGSALKWLADHQQPDGGWSFAHKRNSCPADCQHEGTYRDDRVSATALTLLPFLGAGQTHKTGKYKKNVQAGLYFLVQQMQLSTVDDVSYGSFAANGNLPAQSLCTLALCEAFAMTHDKDLMQPAQFALNELLREPEVLDDGFRWMAIRSGESAYLKVPTRQPHRGQLLRFILSDRSQHKFAAPARNQALVSAAALDRWFLLKAPLEFPLEGNEPTNSEQTKPADDVELQQVVKWLADWGPQGDLDYQYFATQTLRHQGGDPWTEWHKQVAQPLIQAQAGHNHPSGSWYFAADDLAAGGGRLYCTALATMILEVGPNRTLLPAYSLPLQLDFLFQDLQVLDCEFSFRRRLPLWENPSVKSDPYDAVVVGMGANRLPN